MPEKSIFMQVHLNYHYDFFQCIYWIVIAIQRSNFLAKIRQNTFEGCFFNVHYTFKRNRDSHMRTRTSGCERYHSCTATIADEDSYLIRS